MSKQFNHLNIPSHWQSYWTRFPEGHTILEALIQWVSQVDEMVDSYNELTDHVDNFKEGVNDTTDGFREELDTFLIQFDDNLAQNVIATLSEWQQSGFLDIVIDQALETKFHEMDERLTTQLAQTESETKDLINQTEINLRNDIEQHGFDLRWNEHLVVDGDWTQALQQALDDSPDDGRTIFIGQDIRIDSTIIWPNITGDTSVMKPCTIQGMSNNRGSGVFTGYQKGAVTIEFTGEGTLFDLRNGDDSQTNSSVSFRDINLYGQGKEGSIGINADGLLASNFENMLIRSFDIGMRTSEVFYATFDNLRFFYNLSYGLNVEGEVNHTKFHRCNFSQTLEGTGVRVHYGQTGVVFDGCWFEGNQMALRLDYCMQALIQGCYFEANHNTMSILGHAETGHTVVTIIGSNFTTSTDSSTIPIRVNGQSAIKYNITMIGNTINHWTDTGVFLGGTGDKEVVEINNRKGGVSIDYPTEIVLRASEKGIYTKNLHSGTVYTGEVTGSAKVGYMEVFNQNGNSAGFVQLYENKSS